MPRIINALRAVGHPGFLVLRPRPSYPLLARAIEAARRARKIARFKLRRVNPAIRASDLAFENPDALPQFLLAATICGTALVFLIAALTGLIDSIYGPTWVRVLRPLVG